MAAEPGHRSRTSGSEVVELVQATYRALRAERDEARELLRDVADASAEQAPRAPDGTRPVYLDPELLHRIEGVVDGS